MKKVFRAAALILVCLLVVTAAYAEEPPRPRAPKQPIFNIKDRHNWIKDRFLPRLEKTNRQYAVPRADGMLLYSIIRKTDRKSALEMGSANGYSAMWMGMAMEQNGGRLLTIEINGTMAAVCQTNMKRTGLDKYVSCLFGDALKVTPRLKGPFDFLFMDLGPLDVLPFAQAALPKLSKDFIIALHSKGHGHNYKKFLGYARSKGWQVKFQAAENPKWGLGLLLISPKPIDY